MTIKKRIFYSNTFMVFASLLVMLVVGALLINFFKEEFLGKFSANRQLADYTYEVQDILNSAEEYKTSWEKLNNHLEEYEFRLYVVKIQNNEQTKFSKEYSALKHSEIESVKEILKTDSAKEQENHIYFIESTTIIKKIINIEGQKYIVYAANCPSENSFLGMDRGIFEMFLISFFVIGVITIAFILLCSQFVTRQLINRILKPVKALDDAAKRVGDGDLSKAIQYIPQDEFKNVCDSFDMMQLHLKQGMDKNAAYEKARTEMVSGISHDLRTPLTSVKGYIKGILDGIANTEEKKKKYLEIAYKKSCDMDVLLSKLFYFSKLETGNMPFFKQEIVINDFIEKYVCDKKNELFEKNIDLLYSHEEEKYICNIDIEQIKRVFDNIIENSIKYSNVDNLKINIELISNSDKNIIIVLHDNGNGVEEKKLSHLFEQFYRADESRNSKCDGSGLGLYVCKYIINQHEGNIYADNDNGLKITIDLPRQD